VASQSASQKRQNGFSFRQPFYEEYTVMQLSIVVYAVKHNQISITNNEKGSHRIFFKEGIEKINLQPDGSKAKAYQNQQPRPEGTRYVGS
jgi:hypothetical protein